MKTRLYKVAGVVLALVAVLLSSPALVVSYYSEQGRARGKIIVAVAPDRAAN